MAIVFFFFWIKNQNFSKEKWSSDITFSVPRHGMVQRNGAALHRDTPLLLIFPTVHVPGVKSESMTYNAKMVEKQLRIEVGTQVKRYNTRSEGQTKQF